MTADISGSRIYLQHLNSWKTDLSAPKSFDIPILEEMPVMQKRIVQRVLTVFIFDHGE